MLASAPPCRHHEPKKKNSKAHEDVPVAQTSNRQLGTTDVKHDDPDESGEHQAKHDGFEPDSVWSVVAPTVLRGIHGLAAVV